MLYRCVQIQGSLSSWVLHVFLNDRMTSYYHILVISPEENPEIVPMVPPGVDPSPFSIMVEFRVLPEQGAIDK